MKIFVSAVPGARSERVVEIDATHYRIAVSDRAIEGKANEAIARVLAKHLKVPKSRVSLLHGATGKNKVFSIAAQY